MKACTYDVCAKVKTANGKVYSKYFKVHVSDVKNTSTISAESIVLGSKVTVQLSSEGGSGECLYSVLYKKSSDTTWKTAQSYGTATTVAIKPAAAVPYDVCAKVKDENGAISSVYFTVNVSEKQ